MLIRAIVAVESSAMRKSIAAMLELRFRAVVETVRRQNEAVRRIGESPVDLVVADDRWVGPQGLQIFRDLPDRPAIMLLMHGADASRQALLLAGGADIVVPEGVSIEETAEIVKTLLERRQAQVLESLEDRRELGQPRLDDFVSRSPAMQAFMHLVGRVAQSDSSLLILGETGVGKERLARAIHTAGRRGQRPFVAVNCGALPDTLLESELFGHEEGAFTGATRTRRGAFELAHTGMLFLDEIGEMPQHSQVRLLRFLQDREIRRVGGERTFSVDVRVVAATNRDVAREVEQGRFRQDLYYRLGVVTLTLPPLRERREDIPELIESYIAFLRSRIECEVDGIDDEATEALCRYDWPGNVRELINVLERAMLLCEGDTITTAELPVTVSHRMPDQARVLDGVEGLSDLTARPLKEVCREWTDRIERQYLDALLTETRGRIEETASRAGITSRSLYQKMKHLKLNKEDYKRL